MNVVIKPKYNSKLMLVKLFHKQISSFVIVYTYIHEFH